MHVCIYIHTHDISTVYLIFCQMHLPRSGAHQFSNNLDNRKKKRTWHNHTSIKHAPLCNFLGFLVQTTEAKLSTAIWAFLCEGNLSISSWLTKHRWAQETPYNRTQRHREPQPMNMRRLVASTGTAYQIETPIFFLNTLLPNLTTPTNRNEKKRKGEKHLLLK